MSRDDRPRLILDVSRLIWRLWSDRQPTGIDRVCLEYVLRLGDRSLAMVQRGKLCAVLDRPASARLFALLAGPRPRFFRLRLAVLLGTAVLTRRACPEAGSVYVNVGHTGLDNAALWQWLRAHRLRSAIMVHDLIPITHPAFCRPGEAEKHRLRMSSVAAWADGVIANSADTRDSFLAFASDAGHAGLPIVVAPLGIAPPADRGREPLPTEQWFVVLGTIEARKGHAFLFRVWDRLFARLGAQTPRLYVIGQRGWEADEAFAWLDRPHRDRDRVVERNAVSDEQLIGLLKGARALLMPSLVEGFGLPVAEALALGTPVLATDLAVYREFAGDFPEYLPPLDEERWAAAIAACLDGNPAYHLRRAAIADYSPPTWAAHFATVEPWMDGLDRRG